MSFDKPRIHRVTTRSGDRGQSGLADGSRLPKHAPVFDALGDLDELNAGLGVLRAQWPDAAAEQGPWIDHLQHRLFDLGAELAVPGMTRLTEEDVAWIEARLTEINTLLPPLKEFVLPGGSPAASWCHMMRTIARRTERHLWALHAVRAQNPHSLAFLNRLSDLLFVLARHLNRQTGAPETLWHNP